MRYTQKDKEAICRTDHRILKQVLQQEVEEELEYLLMNSDILQIKFHQGRVDILKDILKLLEKP